MSTLKTTFIQKVGNGTAAFELPAADGSAGQVLSTNGSGALSWTTANPLGSAAAVSGTNFQFNSGYGSVATAYGCRAWVNFNGTGTTGTNQTIRASGNVTSVYKNGTGDYTVNFTTAMPDANYCATMGIERDYTPAESQASVRTHSGYPGGRATSSFRLVTEFSSGGGQATDQPAVYVAIFR